MAVCPKCSQVMFAQGDKMVCLCGYQYRLPQRKPTYEQLIQFLQDNQYEQELQDWLEAKNESL